MMFLRIFLLVACTALCFVQSVQGAEFTCPSCSAQGENADRDCDTNIKYVPCPLEEDPVCVLTVTTKSSIRKARARYCASREFYNLMKARCEARGTCRIVMCDTSGCKVDIPE